MPYNCRKCYWFFRQFCFFQWLQYWNNWCRKINLQYICIIRNRQWYEIWIYSVSMKVTKYSIGFFRSSCLFLLCLQLHWSYTGKYFKWIYFYWCYHLLLKCFVIIFPVTYFYWKRDTLTIMPKTILAESNKILNFFKNSQNFSFC